MKSLLLSLCAFFCFASTPIIAADTLSTYLGRHYSADQEDLCRQDYGQIAAGLDSQEGFRVLEGGCVKTIGTGYQIKLSYSHPLISRIETFYKKNSTSELCQTNAAQARVSFEKLGHHFVAAYCQGRRLVVDHIDFSSSVISELNVPAAFVSKENCRNSLQKLDTKLAERKVSLLFHSCVPKKTYEGEEYYRIEGNISAKYTKTISFIGGKKSEGRTCMNDYANIERDFERNGMNLAHAFCAPATTGKDAREVMAVITYFSSTTLETFKGASYSERSRCENQLAKAAQGLEDVGRPVLYKFCGEGYRDTYRPVIYYARNYNEFKNASK